MSRGYIWGWFLMYLRGLEWFMGVVGHYFSISDRQPSWAACSTLRGCIRDHCASIGSTEYIILYLGHCSVCLSVCIMYFIAFTTVVVNKRQLVRCYKPEDDECCYTNTSPTVCNTVHDADCLSRAWRVRLCNTHFSLVEKLYLVEYW